MEPAHRAAEAFGADCIYHYERTHFIGKGAFGAVYKALVKVKGNYTGEETVAVKEILFSHGDTKLYHGSNEHSKMHEKWKLLVGLDHENVVPYYKITCSFTEHGCLRLELMMRYITGGDLLHLINRCKEGAELSKKVAVNLSLQMSDGLNYLHQKGIIHGDFKPENVLVEPLQISSTHDEFLLQIADVDNCVQLQRSVTCSKDGDHLVGTYRYMSPEMIKTFCGESAEVIGRKTDVWSAGCVLHDLFDCVAKVQGRWLCKGDDKVEVTRNTTSAVFSMKIVGGYLPYISPSIPVDLSDILRHCMTVDVSRRMSAKFLLESMREIYLGLDERIGIGLKIGNKSVSIAIFRNGISRFLTAFPSVAAYKSDPAVTECYFGWEAQGYLRRANYTRVACLNRLLHPEGDDNPVLLDKLFAYVVELLSSNGIYHIERIAMVLPQSVVDNVAAQQNLRSAWKRNLVHKVTLISYTSAHFLAYASSNIGRCLLQRTGDPDSIAHLIICKAGYDNFLLEEYTIRNNFFLVRTEGAAVLLGCLGKMRLSFFETIRNSVVTSDSVAGPPNPFYCVQKNEQRESEELLRLFLEGRADTGTIHLDHNIDASVGHNMFSAIAQPVLDEIRNFVVAELTKRGLLDKKGCTYGSCRILLFGTYSRFLLLRRFLESLQQQPLDKSILNYVDTSEALGAAVASYLDDVTAGTEGRRLLETDFQKDNFFDLTEITKALSKSIVSGTITVSEKIAIHNEMFDKKQKTLGERIKDTFLGR